MKHAIRTRFDSLAAWTARNLGSPYSFCFAVLLVVIWAASGPVLGFSDSWQLIINTSTTIATFLMVFLIQNSETRSTTQLSDQLTELSKDNRELLKRLDYLETLLETRHKKIRVATTKISLCDSAD